MAQTILRNASIPKEPVYLWLDEKTEVVLFHDGVRWRAFQSICPHMGAQLAVDQSRKQLACPWHPLTFSALDGKSSHKKYKCVREFQVRELGNEIVIDE